jgi:hypothetical protein
MKKLFIILTLIILIVLLYEKSEARVPDSCLKMELPDGRYGTKIDDYIDYVNPDSVRVDSCVNSPTYLQRYVKKGILFEIKDYFFSQRPLSLDSIYKVEDIDSINYFNVYLNFRILENKYGPIFFTRPQATELRDSFHLENPSFEISLLNYFPFDSIKSDLMTFTEIVVLANEPHIFTTNVQGNSIVSTLLKVVIFNENLTIIIPDNSNSSTIRVSLYNTYGEELLQQSFFAKSEVNLNISKLINGIYFVRINEETYKFIKY